MILNFQFNNNQIEFINDIKNVEMIFNIMNDYNEIVTFY